MKLLNTKSVMCLYNYISLLHVLKYSTLFPQQEKNSPGYFAEVSDWHINPCDEHSEDR